MRHPASGGMRMQVFRLKVSEGGEIVGPTGFGIPV